MGLLQLKSYFAECFYRSYASPGTSLGLPLLVFDLATDLWHRTWRSVTAFTRTEPALPFVWFSFPVKRWLWCSSLGLFDKLFGTWIDFSSTKVRLNHCSTIKANDSGSDFPEVSQKLSAALNIWKPTTWSWNVHQQAAQWAMIIKSRLHAITLHVTYLLSPADVSRPDADGNKLDKHIIVLNNSSKTIFHLYGPDFLHEPHSLLLRRATKISAMNKFDEEGRNLNARVLSLSMLSQKPLLWRTRRRSWCWHGGGH